ncbi:NfrA family protein [Silvimonas soli]|uniref:NfrA family protein n=1 Tax=Silvimonas soli TaxID=2980100 RepID=UPI0024B3C5EC|nr:tetratricopeptide repeat protein [Silvimonas soli]
MNTSLRVLPALLALALAAPALSATDSRLDLGDEVSGYRRFIIYPHLQKAFALQQRGENQQAISEFLAAQKLVPKNATVALYLADAYQRNGQPDRAEAVLKQAAQRTPKDMRIAEALATLQGAQATQAPEEVSEAGGAAQAPAATDTTCQPKETPVCKAIAGNAALRAGQLAKAQAELDADDGFAASPQGLELRHSLAQRAIFLRDWPRAESQFAALNAAGQLTANERSQWLNLLLTQGRLSDAERLLNQSPAVRGRDQLAYAQALARRGERAALVRYMVGKQPDFQNAADEQQWLSLLEQMPGIERDTLYAEYTPTFSVNRRAQAQALVPRLIASGSDNAAQRMLERLPADEMLRERFTLSVKANQLDLAEKQAAALLRQHDNDPALLDSLTWQLIAHDGQAQAARLLLDNYPFTAAQPARRGILLQRLTGLIGETPALLTAEDKARLANPLATPGPRGHQAALFAGLKDCKQVHDLLGDLSSGYSHDDWMRLGDCYSSDNLPGLAQYSYQQARQRQPDDGYATRAVAYQAFATKDYASAAQAWRSLRKADLLPGELISAANTDLVAGDKPGAAQWLDEYEDRGAVRDDEYWWLRAQTAPDATAERAALERALAQREDARYYQRLATLQSADKQYQEAVVSLQRAQALAPDDAELQATLGYAWWFAGNAAKSRTALQAAHQQAPGDIAITRQLVYSSQRMSDNTAARAYAREVIDYDLTIDPADKTDADLEQQFGFRRLHEDLGRRWSFSAGAFMGTNAGSIANSPEPGTAYRSYSQVEADYRLGDPAIRDGKTLEAYARIFAGSGTEGDQYAALPIYAPMLGTGLRWKPLRDWTFYLAAEYQTPLDRTQDTVSDVMFRASASLFNDGKFSDEWHESGTGWMAQNLYLDAAYYLHQERAAATADYRLSYHKKLVRGQTLEPYAHMQYNLLDQQGYSRDVRAGLGMRWNHWYGETRYDAYPSKISVGLEFQHAFETYLGDTNTVFLTFGGLW